MTNPIIFQLFLLAISIGIGISIIFLTKKFQLSWQYKISIVPIIINIFNIINGLIFMGMY